MKSTSRTKKLMILLVLCIAFIFGMGLASYSYNFEKVFNSFRFPTHKITSSGLVREYLMVVPNKLPKNPSLVIIMHGASGPLGTAQLMKEKSGWSQKAEKEKFIAVFPQGVAEDESKPLDMNGSNLRTWSDGSGISDASIRKIDDVKFISDVIDNVSKKYNVDKNRIYATGFSQGASMSFMLGVSISEKIAAIAPSSGLLYVKTQTLKSPVSLLLTLGMKETPPKRKYVKGPVSIWRELLSCPEKPIRDINNREASIKEYGPCKNGTGVVQYGIKGIGHAYPGRANLFKGGQGAADTISAVDIVWDFFEKHPKKG